MKRIALAVTITLIAAMPAAASLVPSWGPVRLDGKKTRTLTDVDSVAITFSAKGSPDEASTEWPVRISVPDASTSSRYTLTFTEKHALLNGGKPFPLAKVTVRARLTLLARGYTEKIFSSNFDRYWNVCVNEAKTTWAQGGDVYCEVWHPKRVRMNVSAKITNFPRPKVTAENDLGAVAPDCTPGATKTESVFSWKKDTYECRDRETSLKSDYSSYYRTVSVTAQTWSGRRWVSSTANGITRANGPGWFKTGSVYLCSNYNTTPTTYVDEGGTKTEDKGTEVVVSRCSGGQWVETSRTARPAPTISVSSFTQVNSYTWRATGTVSCSYTGYSCPSKIWFKRTDGSWGGTYDYESFYPPTGPFTNQPFDVSTYVFSGATPNGELAYSSSRP